MYYALAAWSFLESHCVSSVNGGIRYQAAQLLGEMILSLYEIALLERTGQDGPCQSLKT